MECKRPSEFATDATSITCKSQQLGWSGYIYYMKVTNIFASNYTNWSGFSPTYFFPEPIFLPRNPYEERTAHAYHVYSGTGHGSWGYSGMVS